MTCPRNEEPSRHVDDDCSDLYSAPDEFDDGCDEPCGSCEWCGTSLYLEGDYDGLCSQCAWHAELSGDGEEDGWQSVI